MRLALGDEIVNQTFQLGVALWRERGNLTDSRVHFEAASRLLASLRRESLASNRGRSKAETMTKKQSEWFDLQTECFEFLQKILVDSGRENEALVVAEVSRNRPFVDLQLERYITYTIASQSTLG